MKLLQGVPDYWEYIDRGKRALEDSKDLWNGGNPLAGHSEDGKQTYFKKPYGYIAVALAFNMAYVMLVLGTVNRWVEKSLVWLGTLSIRLIRLFFGVVILLVSSPIVLVMLTVNAKTGVNTKFGNKLVKENDEKNSDKA
ncbi:hypothetical protein Lw1_gp276 [Escherichia phage Lw1]|uniref:Uncharacterized protein n=1 Tax=Escherichia phage Lw1 TaxID=1307804 RepID=M9UYA4_9CAUD|nr:hypothetical protein Lw1_gp276 [Escherichia phage Lw1]AGJ71681.1 hypothetical protein Lw1_gp276 [Escherichia phage Lw1]